MCQGTGHHPAEDLIPLSAGVLLTSLIGWRLKSSHGSSGLNQSPIETCHLKLIDTIAFSRPAGDAVIVRIPCSTSYIPLMGEMLWLLLRGKKLD